MNSWQTKWSSTICDVYHVCNDARNTIEGGQNDVSSLEGTTLKKSILEKGKWMLSMLTSSTNYVLS